MRGVGIASVVVALAGHAVAGEIVFTNGSRLEGDLANDVLMVSTGSGVIEVAPDQVGLLTANEIRLKDGRVLQGTLVGGRLKARTPLGELVIKPEEIRAFRADGFVVATGGPGPSPAPAPPTVTLSLPSTAPAAAVPSPVPAATAPAAPATGSTASAPVPVQSSPAPDAGLPSVKLYQGIAPAAVEAPRPPASAAPATAAPAQAVAAVAPETARPPSPGKRLEVVAGESALYRDAAVAGSAVGKVVRGQQVTYLDSIDRRLRIYNTVIFDGGHWIKVRVADGTIGWLPAETVREVR